MPQSVERNVRYEDGAYQEQEISGEYESLFSFVVSCCACMVATCITRVREVLYRFGMDVGESFDMSDLVVKDCGVEMCRAAEVSFN